MNPFDSLQSAMFDTVTSTMGYDATWSPSEGGVQQAGRVLYKGPTEKEKLAGIEYAPNNIMMEYKEGVFPDLKSAADRGKKEFVTINDISGQAYDFYVKSVQKLWDGKTYEAHLQVKI